MDKKERDEQAKQMIASELTYYAKRGQYQDFDSLAEYILGYIDMPKEDFEDMVENWWGDIDDDI